MRSTRVVRNVLCGALLVLAGCGQEPGTETGYREPMDTQKDSASLRAAVDVAKITAHMQALEAIGTRPSGSAASLAAVAYIRSRLQAAGYITSEQQFNFVEFIELAPSTLAILSPVAKTYLSGTQPWELGQDVGYMEYSKSGTVEGLIQPTVDIMIPPAAAPSSTSGCELTDFVGTMGRIALVQRGTCTFLQKVQMAAAAGATAVILFNEGQTGRTATDYFTLAEVSPIPAIMVSYATGAELYSLAKAGDVRVRLTVSNVVNASTAVNLIGQSPAGRSDRVVVAGAHLDSAVGVGANDNASGAATLLTIAEQMTALGLTPRNQVRFAFWGAEENGLLGSEHYASKLTPTELKQHHVYLNFDMIASENYALLVYDGDGSATPTAGPNGSGNVEQIMLDYFTAQGMTTFPTALDGRSDYLAFSDRKIPVGGLFTGADELKTPQQAALYGGVAGALLDRNYHTVNDTLANASLAALDIMSDATAHSVLTFALTTSAVTGTSQSSPKATKPPTFKGPRAIR